MGKGEGEELYKKHRPRTFKEVVGQDAAVRMLRDMLAKGKTPHAVLFTGPSGCGKTTLAKILSAKLGCTDHDFSEINCAGVKEAIDTIRGIQSQMLLHPLASPCRVWLLDEVQSFSRAGFAQQALLKMLEDTPSHVYFLLATTDKSKLLKTVVSRCTEVGVQPLAKDVLKKLLTDVAVREGVGVGEKVVDRIVEAAEVAEGGARKALVLLHAVMGLGSEEEQLQCVLSDDMKDRAIRLARLLMDARTPWAAIAGLLKEMDEDPESLRRLVLGYASAVLLNTGEGDGKRPPSAEKGRLARQTRAAFLLTVFSDSIFYTGKPGLVKACYEVFSHEK